MWSSWDPQTKTLQQSFKNKEKIKEASPKHKGQNKEKKGTENYKNNQKTINKAAMSTHFIYFSYLNSEIIGHMVAEWIK